MLGDGKKLKGDVANFSVTSQSNGLGEVDGLGFDDLVDGFGRDDLVDEQSKTSFFITSGNAEASDTEAKIKAEGLLNLIQAWSLCPLPQVPATLHLPDFGGTYSAKKAKRFR